jgi:hypothetical protein
MKPESEKRLKKIQRVGNILRVICKVGFALVICVFLAAMLAILSGRGTVSFSDDSVQLAPLTATGRVLLAAATVLLLAVGLKGVYHLHRLFGNYGRGDIFTGESAGQIRQLGMTVLLWYCANILWAVTAACVVPTPFSIQFHSDSLVTGPIIIVISWFMEMAAEMREENALTI